MQGVYTYIPETNYVPREYSVAAILLLLFTVLISLVSVLNLWYFPKYVCSAQYGCFLEFLNFVLSWYVARVYCYLLLLLLLLHSVNFLCFFLILNYCYGFTTFVGRDNR